MAILYWKWKFLYGGPKHKGLPIFLSVLRCIKNREALFFMNAEASQNPNLLEKLFKLKEKNTSVKTEIIAGMTTFIALAYIMFVNPNILSEAGIPKEAAIASTIWIAALSTMVMGIFANYPVALAPGMGLNAFFTYYVVGVLHLSWQVALGAVFFSGCLFLILTIGGIRQELSILYHII